METKRIKAIATHREYPIADRRKIFRFASGIAVLVMGALMFAESVTASVAGSSFMLDATDRGLELAIGALAIVVAVCIIDESRS